MVQLVLGGTYEHTLKTAKANPDVGVPEVCEGGVCKKAQGVYTDYVDD
jgi:hypothetical protein